MKAYELPCVIGVVGHRVITDSKASIAELAKKVLIKQLDDYPETPVIVLTQFSEGAELIVIHAIAELQRIKKYNDRIQIRFVGPSTSENNEFTVAYYKKFENTSSLLLKFLAPGSASFVQLKTHTNWVGFDESKLGDVNSVEYNVQFANTGAYIARHSNILLAVWDGEYKSGEIKPTDIGGTEQVVSYMLDRPMNFAGSNARLPEYLSSIDGIGYGEFGQLIQIKVSSKNIDADPTLPKIMPAQYSRYPDFAVIDDTEKNNFKNKLYKLLTALPDRIQNKHYKLLRHINEHNKEFAYYSRPGIITKKLTKEDGSLYFEKSRGKGIRHRLYNWFAGFFDGSFLFSRLRISADELSGSKAWFYSSTTEKEEFEPLKSSRDMYGYFNEAAGKNQILNQNSQRRNIIFIVLAIAFGRSSELFQINTANSFLVGANEWLIPINMTLDSVLEIIGVFFIALLFINNTRASIKKYKLRFLKNRVAAELIRLEVPLMIMKLRASVTKLFYFAPELISHTILWVRLQADTMYGIEHPKEKMSYSDRLEMVKADWIDDQLDYATGNRLIKDNIDPKSFKNSTIDIKEYKLNKGRKIQNTLVWVTTSLLMIKGLLVLGFISSGSFVVGAVGGENFPFVILFFVIIMAYYNRENNIMGYQGEVKQNDELRGLYLLAKRQLNNYSENRYIQNSTLIKLYGLIANLQVEWGHSHKKASINELGPLSKLKNVTLSIIIITVITLFAIIFNTQVAGVGSIAAFIAFSILSIYLVRKMGGLNKIFKK